MVVRKNEMFEVLISPDRCRIDFDDFGYPVETFV